MTIRELCVALDDGRDVGQLTPETMRAVRWYSVHQGVKRVSDAHNALATEANKRAGQCRYHNMAQDVIGPLAEIIYDPAYGEIEIGGWEVSS